MNNLYDTLKILENFLSENLNWNEFVDFKITESIFPDSIEMYLDSDIDLDDIPKNDINLLFNHFMDFIKTNGLTSQLEEYMRETGEDWNNFNKTYLIDDFN